MMVVATLGVEPARVNPDTLYEVIDGEIREIPHMGARASHLANQLLRIFSRYLDANPIGDLAVETLFRFDEQSRLQRRPDLAIVANDRLVEPLFPPEEDPPVWDVVPNFAVEVISPSNTASEIEEKLRDYFRHGVELVWVIHPVFRRIYVYEAIDRVSLLTESGTLTGGTVLPGFSVAVVALFAERQSPR